MRRAILVTVMLILSLIVLTCGCTQQDSTLVITVQQLQNDRQTNLSADYLTFTIGLKSYKEGDSITIEDKISNISYDSENHRTECTFDVVSNEAVFDFTIFYFKGDLTGTYKKGNNVRITVTIKQVEISMEFGNSTITYNIEIFDEQWKDEEFFKHNVQDGYPFKPLPERCIEKI